jgi:hypothetical protein
VAILIGDLISIKGLNVQQTTFRYEECISSLKELRNRDLVTAEERRQRDLATARRDLAIVEERGRRDLATAEERGRRYFQKSRRRAVVVVQNMLGAAEQRRTQERWTFQKSLRDAEEKLEALEERHTSDLNHFRLEMKSMIECYHTKLNEVASRCSCGAFVEPNLSV